MDLREIRKMRGLTVSELEKRAGTGRLFIARLEHKSADIDNCRIGLCKKCAEVLGISLEEFYNAAKAVQPTHKVGNPLMVKGQPAKIRGDSWKYRRDDGLERPGKKYERKKGLKPTQNTSEDKE